MRSPFRPSNIVGLDLGASGPKAVAICSSLRRKEIMGLGASLTTGHNVSKGEEKPAEALRELLGYDIFPAERLVSGLKGDQVAVRSFALPRFQRQNGDALVKFEMEALLPFHAEEIVVDYQSRPLDDGKQVRVLALAARKAEVAEQLGMLAELNMEPRSLSWNTLGAYAALVNSPAMPEKGTNCILDLGCRSTAMVVFDEGGPILVRSLDIGGQDLTDALASELNVDATDAERIKREQGVGPQAGEQIRRALEQVLANLIQEVEISRLSLKVEFERIIITGGASKLPGIDAFFRERMGVECARFDAFQHFRHRLPASAAANGPEYTAAVGLALAALGSGPAGVNFLREEFAPKKALALVRSKLMATGILGIFILGFFGANFFFDLHYKQQRFEALNEKIRNVFTATFPNVKNVVNEERQMTAAIDQAKRGLASVAVSRQGGGSLLDALNTISREASQDQGIKITELSLGEKEIQLAGEAQSFESVNRLRDQLDRQEAFDKVVVEGASANEFSKRIEFNIRMERVQS